MAITQQSLQTALTRANTRMQTLGDTLNAADAKLGDGDTGTMLSRLIGTFAAVDIAETPDLGATFIALAKAGTSATGSSLGTLIIGAMMTSGKFCANQQALDWGQLAPMLRTIRDGAMARGKAELGAKTIIDALDALAASLDGLSDPAEMATAANAAMEDVLNTFRNRPCTMGRARMFAEKSIGLDDPGMLALAELVWAVTGVHSASPGRT